MTRPSPYNLTIGEDGLTIRCEWDAHYLTDEQLEMVRRYVEMLQAENADLRDLVFFLMEQACRKCTERVCEYENEFVMCTWMERARELGVEVDA